MLFQRPSLFIRRTVIYPVDSAIQRLNNRGLEGKGTKQSDISTGLT